MHGRRTQAGLPGSDGRTVLPLTQRLSSEVLERHGIYLGDDGQVLRLYVGRGVAAELCQQLFGVAMYDAIRGGKVSAVLGRRRVAPWAGGSRNRAPPSDMRAAAADDAAGAPERLFAARASDRRPPP